jgi:hypothetical protein
VSTNAREDQRKLCNEFFVVDMAGGFREQEGGAWLHSTRGLGKK